MKYEADFLKNPKTYVDLNSKTKVPNKKQDDDNQLILKSILTKGLDANLNRVENTTKRISENIRSINHTKDYINQIISQMETFNKTSSRPATSTRPTATSKPRSRNNVCRIPDKKVNSKAKYNYSNYKIISLKKNDSKSNQVDLNTPKEKSNVKVNQSTENIFSNTFQRKSSYVSWNKSSHASKLSSFKKEKLDRTSKPPSPKGNEIKSLKRKDNAFDWNKVKSAKKSDAKKDALTKSTAFKVSNFISTLEKTNKGTKLAPISKVKLVKRTTEEKLNLRLTPEDLVKDIEGIEIPYLSITPNHENIEEYKIINKDKRVKILINSFLQIEDSLTMLNLNREIRVLLLPEVLPNLLPLINAKRDLVEKKISILRNVNHHKSIEQQTSRGKCK